jgi:hypothetical protein
MKTFPVVFQAGSQDENEDREVPNRRTSGNPEDEGTTIGRNAGGPRGGYNQESETQDNAGSRSSRDSRSYSSRSYDADDYGDTRRGTSQRSSSRYGDDEYGSDRRSSQSGRYVDEDQYDTRRTTSRTQGGMQMAGVNPASLQLHQQIAQRCLQNAQRELSDKRGSEFDMAFMGMQIVAHNRMLATLEASREQASPQLARLIDEGIQTTEQHLDHAREIVENLQRDQQRSSGRDRRSSSRQ